MTRTANATGAAVAKSSTPRCAVLDDTHSPSRTSSSPLRCTSAELRLLEYFVAVAREQHFGKAALRLFIDQSAISRGIKRLEEILGVELLVRGPHGVVLTAAGRLALAHADQLLEQHAAFVHELRRFESAPDRSITISFDGAFARLLAASVRSYRSDVGPAVRVRLKTSPYAAPADHQLSDQRADFALVTVRPDEKRFDCAVVARCRPAVVVPPWHRLVDHPSTTLEDIARERELRPAAATAAWLTQWSPAGLRGDLNHASQDFSLLSDALIVVAADVGLVALPYVGATKPALPSLCCVDVDDAEDRPVYLVWRRDGRSDTDATPLVRAFLSTTPTVDSSGAFRGHRACQSVGPS